MLIIAHRGNQKGPSSQENQPNYVDQSLNEGFDCEVDLWVIKNEYFLGHSNAQYKVDLTWLISRQQQLWIHCKNADALFALNKNRTPYLNFFWHQNDFYTLTSLGFIWVYPGEQLIKSSVAVLPENWPDSEKTSAQLSIAFAICTDYANIFRTQSQQINSLHEAF